MVISLLHVSQEFLPSHLLNSSAVMFFGYRGSGAEHHAENCSGMPLIIDVFPLFDQRLVISYEPQLPGGQGGSMQ